MLSFVISKTSGAGLVFAHTGVIEKDRFDMTVVYLGGQSPITTAVGSADKNGVGIARE
jgi:hypothetical protein